uniref:Uncharacterized protein n=1 Tax=Oryza glaberrima TaxID=4538 RepID=I1Q227_ORYGL
AQCDLGSPRLVGRAAHLTSGIRAQGSKIVAPVGPVVEQAQCDLGCPRLVGRAAHSNDLWNDDKDWDVQKLNSLFEQEVVHKILQVHISQGSTEDKLCWKYSKKVNAIQKSAYKEFIKREEHRYSQDTESILTICLLMIKSSQSWSIEEWTAFPMETGTTFLTDNSTIADTAKRRNFLEEPGHWSLRPLWTQIISSTSIDLIQVRWVPREVNKMADKLAKEAKSGTRRNFIQNCQNIEHSAYPHRSFYARLLNDNFRSLNCTINYVLCF